MELLAFKVGAVEGEVGMEYSGFRGERACLDRHAQIVGLDWGRQTDVLASERVNPSQRGPPILAE